MIDLTTREAFRDLQEAALDGPVEDLARSLYGPAWRSSLIQGENQTWRTRRLPKAADVGPQIIAPLLSGVLAHDGRSLRTSRQAGWWAWTGSAWTGSAWTEASLALLSGALLAAVDRLLEEAQSDAELERLRVTSDEAKRPAQLLALSAANKRSAVLEALRAFVASDACQMLGGVTDYLRALPEFQLPDAAKDAFFCKALQVAMLEADIRPGEAVAPADLQRAMEDVFPLPRRDFYSAADRVLGRERGHLGRFYRIPDEEACITG